MCGIAGWIDFARDLRGQAATVQAMVGTLSHRGPDDEGIWVGPHAALAHRRLAIIDVKHGRQPMTAQVEGRNVVLVYSGEAYNYRELRDELRLRGHRFRTASDTEVVLHAYLEWGEGLVDRLVGMYAFAVWDGRTDSLLLVRDRLGIKPLFYWPLHDGVLFGSEPKAILTHPDAEAVLDEDGVYELFSPVRTPGHAVFARMEEVRPGCAVEVTRAGLRERRYWSLEPRRHEDELEATVATTRALLEESVRSQLVADVPLCSLLSGGIDSTAVTALAQRALAAEGAGPVRSYSVTFAGGDGGDHGPDDPFRPTVDTPFAVEAAAALGGEHADITLGLERLTDDDARLAPLMARDLPSLGDLDVSLYLLFQAVRGRATVALSGEGADELFGGYRWFHDDAATRADTFPWVAMARTLGRYSMFDGSLAGIDLDGYQAQRFKEAVAEVPQLDGESADDRRMRIATHLHITRFLPSPLDRKDRMSMAVGLEVRVPFCDHRLVEYVYSIPWAVKTLDGQEKGLLRAAAADVVPSAVRTRQKSPYPTVRDPAYHVSLRDAVNAVLADRSAPVHALVRRPTVRALAAMPPTGVEAVRVGLERVLALNEWLTRYRVRLRLP